MLGKKKFYFVPDVNADSLILKNDYVIATEFDNKDNTFKVRFLNGESVQAWAVADDEEGVKKAFEKFQGYRKVWHECFELIQPAEKKIRETYESMYGEFMDIKFGELIRDLHDPEKIAERAKAKMEKKNGLKKSI